LTALARSSGVSVSSIGNYEAGRAQPSAETLAVLADALGIPEAFLGADDVAELPAEAASFRALSKMSAARRDEATSAGRLATELNKWIEARFRLPAANVPRLERPDQGAEAAAAVVREQWQLGEMPVGNLVHLLEANGVRVFTLPERLTDVDAFSFWSGSTPYLLLNTRKGGERGRFDAAHELGHLVMHADLDLPESRTREAEANRFAAAFLMPSAAIKAQGLQHATIDRIIQGKKKWSVAAMALTHRLHELGLLTDWEYQSRCKQLSQRGYRRHERGGMARESSQLLEKVLRALRQSGGSPQDIAQGLHLRADELSDYMFALVPTVLSGGGQGSAADRPKLELLRDDSSGTLK
jgi:Zn-dependent peptidase ImmA (M78 family)